MNGAGKRSLLAICIVFANVTEANDKHEFGGRIELGIESDSTIIIDEIDRVDATNNNANLLRLSLNYDYQYSEKDKFSGSVINIRKDFEKSNQFDSTLQIFSGSYSHEFANYSVGIRNQFIRSDLNTENFMNMEQYAPYVSFFVGRHWFVNLSYSFADKRIKTSDVRSAYNRELGVNLYYFLQGINHYVLFSTRYRDENARDDLFNYTSEQYRLSWVRKFHWGGLLHKLRLSTRFQRRDFNQKALPGTEDFRVDYQRQWEAQWETNINDNWLVAFTIRESEQDSNFIVAQYEQETRNLTLQYQF